MSVPPGTEMFQFPGFASYTYVFSARYLLLGGFPHSEISGSTIARISPKLIAACHVLHRLLAPRHPPSALNSLSPTTHAPTRRTISPTRRYLCSRHSSMLSITQPMRLTIQRANPLLLHTNPDSHVKTARPHQNSTAFVKVSTSSSRQTGFSMWRKPSPREGITTRSNPQPRQGRLQRQPPNILWRLSDSNR